MDGVLEGAAALCVCKQACSLLFLPLLSASLSPVSFCCCCLLLFTDFIVTIFLVLLWITASFLPHLFPAGAAIALRFLLFLSRTYGAVLLLATPLMAIETVVRLQWLEVHSGTVIGEERQDSLRQRSKVSEMDEDEQAVGEDKDPGRRRRLSVALSYLCCLSVWVFSGLFGGFGWKLEELQAAACIHNTNSLIACLPNLLSRLMPGTLEPYGALALVFVLLLLTMGTSLHRRHRALAQSNQRAQTCGWKHGTAESKETGQRQHFLTLPWPSKTANSRMLVLEPTLLVDQEISQSSHHVHRECSCNSMQIYSCHGGHFDLLSLQCLSTGQGGHGYKGTKRGISFIHATETHTDSAYRSLCGWRQWGFPCLWVNIMTGLVGVLSVCVLPLNLSVNILLILTIETFLELAVNALVSLQQREERDPTVNTNRLC